MHVYATVVYARPPRSGLKLHSSKERAPSMGQLHTWQANQPILRYTVQPPTIFLSTYERSRTNTCSTAVALAGTSTFKLQYKTPSEAIRNREAGRFLTWDMGKLVDFLREIWVRSTPESVNKWPLDRWASSQTSVCLSHYLSSNYYGGL